MNFRKEFSKKEKNNPKKIKKRCVLLNYINHAFLFSFIYFSQILY